MIGQRVGRAEQGGVGVDDDAGRDRRHQARHRRLGLHAGAEAQLVDVLDQARRDAARDEHARRGAVRQRQIAADAGHDVEERLDRIAAALRVVALKVSDLGRGQFLGDLAADRGDRLIEVHEAGAGQHHLDGDAAVLAAQEAQHFGFVIVDRAERDVARLGGQAVRPVRPADQHRGAEARARAHDGVNVAEAGPDRADGLGVRVRQVRQAVGQRGVVVDQLRRLGARDLRQAVLAHLPVEIGELDRPVLDRTGDRHAGVVEARLFADQLEIGRQGRVEVGVIRRLQRLEMRQSGLAVLALRDGEAGVSAADVPDQPPDRGAGDGAALKMRCHIPTKILRRPDRQGLPADACAQKVPVPRRRLLLAAPRLFCWRTRWHLRGSLKSLFRNRRAARRRS